jgi:hypothetical protein
MSNLKSLAIDGASESPRGSATGDLHVHVHVHRESAYYTGKLACYDKTKSNKTFDSYV